MTSAYSPTRSAPSRKIVKPRTRRTARWLGFLGTGAVVLFAACSSAGPEPTAEPVPETQARAEVPRPGEYELVEGPVSPDGLQVILGTIDLSVGTNRMGVVLTSLTGLVTEPTAIISSRVMSETVESAVETASAVFRPWPYGTRGMYTTNLTFDQPGRWEIDVVVDFPDGTTKSARLSFEVLQASQAPPVGANAIASRTKTANDVESLSQITTGSLQDPELYQTTLYDAVHSGTPTVVVFASPAFCTNAVCGPQVEVLQELKDKYRDRANFIHVDFYDNPEGIQGDLDNGVLSPAVIEWALPSTEWTFVIDGDGVISARFEAFATFEEVEEALLSVI